MRRSGSERVKMGCAMFDTARAFAGPASEGALTTMMNCESTFLCARMVETSMRRQWSGLVSGCPRRIGLCKKATPNDL